jgi:hypothetical protein
MKFKVHEREAERHNPQYEFTLNKYRDKIIAVNPEKTLLQLFNQRVMGMQLIAMRPASTKNVERRSDCTEPRKHLPHSSLGASQTTVVSPLFRRKRRFNSCKEKRRYQLFPMTVIGEQLRPTSTARPVRSRPRTAATAEAAVLLDGTTLSQHWLEVGVVTGGGGVPFGMAAARV